MKMGNKNPHFTVVKECKIDGNTTATIIVATVTGAKKTDADRVRNAAKKLLPTYHIFIWTYAEFVCRNLDVRSAENEAEN
jgi:hypothetical protein